MEDPVFPSIYPLYEVRHPCNITYFQLLEYDRVFSERYKRTYLQPGSDCIPSGALEDPLRSTAAPTLLKGEDIFVEFLKKVRDNHGNELVEDVLRFISGLRSAADQSQDCQVGEGRHKQIWDEFWTESLLKFDDATFSAKYSEAMIHREPSKYVALANIILTFQTIWLPRKSLAPSSRKAGHSKERTQTRLDGIQWSHTSSELPNNKFS